MRTDIILYSFSVALCVQISHQCFCPWWGYVKVAGEDIPKIVCHGDKYVVAKIESSTKIQSPRREIRFDVIILKIITQSGVENIAGGRKGSLFAPISDGACGYIDFKIGKTVYVSVREDRNNRLTFNGCSFGRTVDEVTEVQQRVMKGELSCPIEQQ